MSEVKYHLAFLVCNEKLPFCLPCPSPWDFGENKAAMRAVRATLENLGLVQRLPSRIKGLFKCLWTVDQQQVCHPNNFWRHGLPHLQILKKRLTSFQSWNNKIDPLQEQELVPLQVQVVCWNGKAAAKPNYKWTIQISHNMEVQWKLVVWQG